MENTVPRLMVLRGGAWPRSFLGRLCSWCGAGVTKACCRAVFRTILGISAGGGVTRNFWGPFIFVGLLSSKRFFEGHN